MRAHKQEHTHMDYEPTEQFTDFKKNLIRMKYRN